MEKTFKIGGKTYTDTNTKFNESGFGDLYLVIGPEPEKKKFILKRAKTLDIPLKTKENFKNLKKEYDILNAIRDCPHIIKVFEFNRDEEKDEFAEFLVEYAEGGDLFDFVKDKIKNDTKISIEQFLSFTSQLFIALECFHKRHIYNLDIKLENIVFLDKEHTKLAMIDFGLSIKQDEDKCKGVIGTKGYQAPEMSRDKEYKCSAADIYSLGIVFVHLKSITEGIDKRPDLLHIVYKMTSKIRATIDKDYIRKIYFK